jgi:hypothetical protein
MTRNRLYVFLSAACLAGYIWLVITYNKTVLNNSELGVCLFKRLTTIPCPSCGSTRSVLSLLKGDIPASLHWNPFGMLIMAVLVVAPPWILIDMIFRKASLFQFFMEAERLLKRKPVAVAAVIIVLMNWIWNIYKDI